MIMALEQRIENNEPGLLGRMARGVGRWAAPAVLAAASIGCAPGVRAQADDVQPYAPNIPHVDLVEVGETVPYNHGEHIDEFTNEGDRFVVSGPDVYETVSFAAGSPVALVEKYGQERSNVGFSGPSFLMVFDGSVEKAGLYGGSDAPIGWVSPYGLKGTMDPTFVIRDDDGNIAQWGAYMTAGEDSASPRGAFSNNDLILHYREE